MPLRIQRLLCKHYQISNAEALQLLASGVVLINGTVAQANQRIHKTDQVVCRDTLLQEKIVYEYLALYKPRGIECTSNPEIVDRLVTILPEQYQHLYNVGRLDKDTEGLLFLTNDSAFYDAVADSSSSCEKEYRITVTQVLNEEDLQTMREGMVIMGQKTRPCTVTRINDHVFQIILTQGLNRQIRRICYKLGYDIEELKRIRIGEITVGELSQKNLLRSLSPQEVNTILGQ